MKNAIRELIKAGLGHGYTCSVWDGEEWQVKRSTSFKACMDAVQSVEEAQLRFRDQAGEIVGWALVSDGLDLDPDERVIDCTCQPWIQSALSFTLEI
jgi:hypothetical protein